MFIVNPISQIVIHTTRTDFQTIWTAIGTKTFAGQLKCSKKRIKYCFLRVVTNVLVLFKRMYCFLRVEFDFNQRLL